MKHLKYGGSTAARTLACRGWLDESEGIPRHVGDAAWRGTALHECFEEAVMNPDLPTSEFLGQVIHAGPDNYTVTQDDIDGCLIPALAAAQILIDQLSGPVEVEAEVFTKVNDLVGGSADLILANKDTVVVVDLKTGHGHQVWPEENAQLMFYAWVSAQNPDVADMFEGRERVVLAIIQPNDRDLPELRTWETTMAEVQDFGIRFMAAVKEAETGEADLHVGDHCLFCPASSICSERLQMAQNALRLDPQDLEILANNLDVVSDLRSWMSDVEKMAFNQLETGAGITGWKLVAKRAVTKYTVDAETLFKRFRRRLGGKITMCKPHEIKSPTQLKKLAKLYGVKIDFDAITEQRSSGNAIARESDKRPAVLSLGSLQNALSGLGNPGQYSTDLNENAKANGAEA